MEFSIQSVKKVMRNESLLIIAAVLALISFFFSSGDVNYSEHINVEVIILLFCLMACVAGLNETGAFQTLFSKLTSKTVSVRNLSLILIFVCFFSSMVITNDVALITFVPLTMLLLNCISSKRVVFLIVMETAAANLGSMVTPMGNPHNIFLYSYYGMSLEAFISAILPFAILGFIMILAAVFMLKDYKIDISTMYADSHPDKIKMVKYLILFAIAVLAVVNVINYLVCLLIVLIVLLFTDRSAFKKIDYSLLLTFLFFFIFSANIGSVDQINQYIVQTIEGREVATSIILSQAISNVPTAVMLAPFTNNGIGLLIGTNLGGLGTPIASLASLISYRLYTAQRNDEKIDYLKTFFNVNVSFLVILIIFAAIIL